MADNEDFVEIRILGLMTRRTIAKKVMLSNIDGSGCTGSFFGHI
jgi:hypothetical protein